MKYLPKSRVRSGRGRKILFLIAIFLIGALFKDGGANAIAACFGVSMDQSIAGGAGQLALNFKVAAGGTAAQTYTFRIGANSGSFYLNGNSGGRKLGGVVPAYMQITEKKV